MNIRCETRSTRSAFVAVDWGSSNFRAQLIDASGVVLDEYSEARGVSGLDRDGMVHTMQNMKDCFSESDLIICSGMIGSTVGWIDAPYIECPTQLIEIANNLVPTVIGDVPCRIVPGLACVSEKGDPDVMRGEEVEILGLLSLYPELNSGEVVIGLPGTHTKWVKLRDGVVERFYTTMTGEIFDKLSSSGLLASVINSDAKPDEVFQDAVRRGVADGAALTRLLFGVRARVVRGLLQQKDAGSYARGILIGSEIADLISAYPQISSQARTIIVGNNALCELYKTSMRTQGLTVEIADKSGTTALGYYSMFKQLAVAA